MNIRLRGKCIHAILSGDEPRRWGDTVCGCLWEIPVRRFYSKGHEKTEDPVTCKRCLTTKLAEVKG